MDQNIEKIISIYKNYGFEVHTEEPEILSFLYKKGRYFGVDLIPLNNSLETEEKLKIAQEKFYRLHYAVNTRDLKASDELANELYKSFFSFDLTLIRLKKKYQEFHKKQTKNLLGNEYEYIEGPYELYDGDSGSDLTLLNKVENILLKDTPQLIILEAAAGYGKTCAAYEILNRMTNQKEESVSPLFTELSKNRGAKIFRYILLDEIDLEFPTLNSDLVIHEIKNGRVPLIIDGFDELLDKVNISNMDEANAFEEIETMLDTIGNLLERNSKIILTTRKTAIFSGLEFEKWSHKWDNRFEITRLSLKEPRLKDWLGEDRFEKIKEKNIPIQYIANPVILSYLKNITTEDFDLQILNPDLLIKQYFDRMLEREKERQHLIITVEKQYEIFKNVARMLLDFDVTVESKEFFKEIIKDQNTKLLEYTRTLYSGQEKPTLENLVDTLATHALLDRKGRNESQIGFINDFILGILIGEIICETPIDKIEKDFSYYMLDLACTAYKVQNIKNKLSLWEKVNQVTNKLQPSSIFNYDISLIEHLARNHTNLTLYDSTYYNITFCEFEIKNTAFLNCYFKNCFFDTSVFNGVSFIDCTFDSCGVINEEFIDSSKNVSTVKCKVKDCHIIEHYDYPAPEEQHIFNELEQEILNKICSISGTKSHHIMKVLHFFERKQYKDVNRSLESLEKRNFIQIRGNHINFNINKISIIKSELGI